MFCCCETFMTCCCASQSLHLMNVGLTGGGAMSVPPQSLCRNRSTANSALALSQLQDSALAGRLAVLPRDLPQRPLHLIFRAPRRHTVARPAQRSRVLPRGQSLCRFAVQQPGPDLAASEPRGGRPHRRGGYRTTTPGYRTTTVPTFPSV